MFIFKFSLFLSHSRSLSNVCGKVPQQGLCIWRVFSIAVGQRIGAKPGRLGTGHLSDLLNFFPGLLIELILVGGAKRISFVDIRLHMRLSQIFFLSIMARVSWIASVSLGGHGTVLGPGTCLWREVSLVLRNAQCARGPTGVRGSVLLCFTIFVVTR